MDNLVFVYGSLKRGYPLNQALSRSLYVSKATAGPQYTLLEGDMFPFLVERKGIGARGELYLVDDRTLEDLDRIEGHPNFYKRKQIKITDEFGQERTAFAYIHPDNRRMTDLVETFEWGR